MTNAWLTLLLIIACNSETTPSAPATEVFTPPGTDIGLSYRDDMVVEMSTPPNSRAEGQAAPEKWLVTTPWTVLRSNESVVEYATDKPYRLLTYGAKNGNRPDGMTIEAEGSEPLMFKKQRAKKVGLPNTWGLTHHKLALRLPADAAPPKDVWVELPKATREELRRNKDTAGLSEKDFVFRTIDLKEVKARGLFLPAPASISFKFTVPPNGLFETTAHLLPSAISSAQKSDGAILRVSIAIDTTTVEMAEVSVGTDQSRPVQIDLSQWTGSEVSLHLRTDQQANPLFDYVFLQDPVVYVPKDSPNRVLFTIIDTLRSDHLGAYGYERNTSPNIDAFAASAVLFEQARAPAPWTLPSTLAAMYGRTPEHVSGHSHLGEILGREGWATCAVISNNWLLAPDTLGAGWSEHWAQPQSNAAVQAKKSKECLQRYPNRNVLLFMHMIDPHTPYIERKAFRNRFEKSTPKVLKRRVIGQKLIKKALGGAKNQAQKDELYQYLIDRYDQNIVAVDNAFGDVLQQLGSDAIVVVTSDHGEEFADHGGYAHGHTLFDELLRVPLVIRAPGFAPHRVSAPTTLMDIVPTLLALLGQPSLATPTHGTTGMNLVDAAMAYPNSEEPLFARPLAIGRIWLGDWSWTSKTYNQWGTVVGGKKWISTSGSELLFDLEADPQEKNDISDQSKAELATYPGWLSKALQRPVKQVLRIAHHPKGRHSKDRKYSLNIQHPAGIAQAWVASDVRNEHAHPIMENGGVVLPELADKKTPTELFVLLPEGATPKGLKVAMSSKRGQVSKTIESTDYPPSSRLLVAGRPKNGFSVDTAWQSIPSPSGGVRFNGEVTDDLRALGYID